MALKKRTTFHAKTGHIIQKCKICTFLFALWLARQRSVLVKCFNLNKEVIGWLSGVMIRH